ncbi:MAG: cytochrome C oxidase subunit IV family protein [Chloroflexi bacterium]|nr:cytochrome C oxidase subunit IV family protein [Chloroflexota bacterium]
MELWLFGTLWVTSGIFIGGVLTPVLSDGRKFNDWLSMVFGVVLGAVGNVILLIPLWVFVMAQKSTGDHRPAWQRDAISLEEIESGQVGAASAGGASMNESVLALVAVLKENLWPAPREHSHRMSYVGVFAALAIITLVEVSITYMDLPFSIVGPLVALSTSKVLLVALYFMHLRYDSRWYAGLFVFAFPFAAMIITILALD